MYSSLEKHLFIKGNEIDLKWRRHLLSSPAPSPRLWSNESSGGINGVNKKGFEFGADTKIIGFELISSCQYAVVHIKDEIGDE